MKKILISDGCVACGICIPISPFLYELPDGKAAPIEPGTITAKDAEEFLEVVKTCPVHVISVEEAGMVSGRGKESIAELKKLVMERLGNFKADKPNRDDYRFRRGDYRVNPADITGQNRFDYRSYERARSAGLDEFDRVMYSQKRALIQ